MRKLWKKANESNQIIKDPMLLRLISILLLYKSSVCAGYTVGGTDIPNQPKEQFDAIRAWMHDDFRVSNDKSTFSEDNYVCIVLRHHGEVLGYGTAKNLIIAASRALGDVRKHDGFKMDLDDELKKEIVDSISIELEFGDTPIPSPHKNIDRFAYSFHQGLDGIAVRKGNEWNVRMQAELRLSPYRPVSNIVESICINLGVNPTIALNHVVPLDEDVTMYSIPTSAYIQNHSGAEITPLYRGDEIVHRISMSTTHLMGLADQIASHLMKSTGKNGKMIGGYQPETNTLTKMFATHFVQILSAMALQNYADVCRSEAAATSSVTILESVAEDVHQTGTIDIESASLLLLMLLNSTTEYNEQVHTLQEVCETRVRNVSEQLLITDEEALRPFVLSLVAAATIQIGEKYEDNQLLAKGKGLCVRCFRDIPLESRMSIIPWIIEPATSDNTQGEFETAHTRIA